MSISSSAVLVDLNISVWTANKLDRSATDTVNSNANAARDAARVHKNLMAGTRARKDIADLAAHIRVWHAKHTMPWADRGSRLLPTSKFLDYKDQMNKFEDTFEPMVKQFLRDYPTLVQNASQFLGGMFNPDDYPSVDEVASKFGFRLVVSPIPDSGDFRLAIPEQDMAAIRAEYDQQFESRLAEAMKEPWERLHKMLTSMTDKLAKASTGEKTRFHDSFLGNAHEMCAMLTHMNLTKDPKLEEARVKLERALSGMSVENLRGSEEHCADAQKKLDSILGSFDW